REQKGDGRVVPARKQKETPGPAERSANASAALEKAKDLFSKGKKNGDQVEQPCLASSALWTTIMEHGIGARSSGSWSKLPERPGVKLRGQARLFVLFFASGLTRGITMSWTTPWFRDDEKPFLQRTDTMSLDIIRPKDIPRGQVMFPKDYDKSLITEDIHRCQPHYDHLNYLNKPDMSVGCTDPVHVGGKARSYYAPMDRHPRDLSLTTADIELAIPRGGNHKGSRHTDPVCPRYEMPSSYQAPVPEPRWNGRHATDNSDIEKSHPRVLHPDRNYVRDPNEGRDIEYTTPNYAEKLNALRARGRPDFSLNVQDILGTKPARPRCTDPLDPSYKVPTSATTSLHAKYAEEKGLGIELPSLQVREVGHVEGSKSKRLTWDNGEPHLSLLREDIAGALPQRWVGTIPANIYDAPEMRPMITHHDPHDIPGAQVGTLKKGIEGSRRSVNPLNPRYPMLDGNARPQPLPTFEAQRHPMLRSQRGATSMPNLRGSRSLMPAGKRTFTVPEEFAESVALQREALASALPEGSQRLPEMQEQRSQGSQGSQRPSARLAQVDMIQPVPPAMMAEPGGEDAHNTIRFDLPASEAGGLSRRSASSGALPRIDWPCNTAGIRMYQESLQRMAERVHKSHPRAAGLLRMMDHLAAFSPPVRWNIAGAKSSNLRESLQKHLALKKQEELRKHEEKTATKQKTPAEPRPWKESSSAQAAPTPSAPSRPLPGSGSAWESAALRLKATGTTEKDKTDLKNFVSDLQLNDEQVELGLQFLERSKLRSLLAQKDRVLKSCQDPAARIETVRKMIAAVTTSKLCTFLKSTGLLPIGAPPPRATRTWVKRWQAGIGGDGEDRCMRCLAPACLQDS
ncbi:unnamed protein product, partial [Symbiodinium sp. KB8]